MVVATTGLVLGLAATTQTHVQAPPAVAPHVVAAAVAREEAPSRSMARTPVVVQEVAKPKPKPKPVVQKPVKQSAAQKPTKKPAAQKPVKEPKTGAPWSAGEWGRFPARVEQLALCVAHHESWGTHNGRRLWTALNLAGSTASGFAQWIDSTWRANAARAGVRVTSRAYLAPPRDQATVFAWMATHGGMHAWDGTHCPGTS